MSPTQKSSSYIINDMETFQLRREITRFMALFLTTIFFHINNGDAYFLTPLVHSQCCGRGSRRGTTTTRPWNKGYDGLLPSIFAKRSEWDEEFYKEEGYDSKQAKGMRSKGNNRSMYDDSSFRKEDDFYGNYNGKKYNDDYDYDYDDDDDGILGYEDEYDDDNMEVPQNEWEWESYQKSTHIYLPPTTQVPKAIIHFIGGTLFGSYPLQFYKQLLERVARLSNSIVVATSIPVTLTKNPLNHFQLAKNIAIDFNKAYRYVIVDEYGEDVASEMKIVGLGHSLGSRLQMIISTSKKLKRIGFERDGNIFIAFNNYNAYASVPGVKRLESEIQETFNGGYSRNYNRAKYRKKSEYEIGLTDVVNAVSDGIQEQVQSLKISITPDLDKTALEFQPTPQQLWDGIDKNYSVNKTLVVQFDQDLIDQSSRLATAILESEGYKNNDILADGGRNISASVLGHNTTDVGHAGNTTISSKTVQDEDSVVGRINKDIKFARLRGTHLSPVSYSDTFVVQAIKRAGALGQDKILQEAIQEENDYRPSSQKLRTRVQNQDMGNLSCAIARYVSDKIIDIE